MSIFANKISKGMHLRVIAPSRTFKIIGEETREIALKRFAEMGIKVTYSKNCEEMDEFLSSSVDSRIEDLHDAFSDSSVDVILTAIGGFNSNQLLKRIDYQLIKNNPKILCGFSDITALLNAIYAKTGLVTYSGPHFSSFGMKKGFEYSLEFFKKCLFNNTPFEISSSEQWSDDLWFINQEERIFIENDGFWVLNNGKQNLVEGIILGGNLGTLNLLQGTEFMPNLTDVILFVEDCFKSSGDLLDFDRNLTSLLQQSSLKGLKALVIGRFQKESNITRDKLQKIISNKAELSDVPVIANVDFGHTTPLLTLPIGGKAKIEKKAEAYHILIEKH